MKTGVTCYLYKARYGKTSKQESILYTSFSNEIHHEVEVLVKIRRIGKYIEEKFAHKYYQEIGLGIDFTARDLQQNLKDKGLPWEKAKAFDGSALIGNWLTKTILQILKTGF